MANLVTVVALSLRTARATFDAPLSDFTFGATGALNAANWTFTGQITAPVPVAPVNATSVTQISTSIVDVAADDDLSPGQLYQLEAKSASLGGIAGVADSPNNKGVFQAVSLTPPAERDFSILKMVPRMNLREDDTQDLEKFLRILDDVLGLSLNRIDLWTAIFDYDQAPDNFLDLMLQDMAYPLTIALSTIDKRRLLSVLATIYRQKGTFVGVKNAIRFFLGLEVDVVSPDWNLYGGWVLDESFLDVDTVLGGTIFYDPAIYGSDTAVFFGASVFDFLLKIGTPGAIALTADQLSKTTAVVQFMRPLQTHMLGPSAVLPPPTNPAATPGVGQITISWDAVAGATSYVVFVSPTPVVGPLSPIGFASAGSPYIDTVPTGEQRYYVVVAQSAGINGVSSTRVTATAT